MKYNKKKGAVALEFIISAGILGALGFGLVFMNAGDIKKQQQSAANNLRDDQAYIENSKGSESVVINDITLNTDIVHLSIGETYDLQATIKPTTLLNAKLIWEVYKNPTNISTTVSTDTTKLSIKAVENGISKIKVYSNDGSNVYKTIKVIVGNPVTFTASQQNLESIATDVIEMTVYANPADYDSSKVRIVWSVEDGYEYANFTKNVNTLRITPKSGYEDSFIRVHASAYDVLYEETTEFDFTLSVMDVYNITYNYSGAADVKNPITYTKDTPTFTLKNPTKLGYTFIGWTGSNGNTPNTNVQISKGSIGNKNFTANFRTNVYTISYNANGATIGSMSNSTHTYDVSQTLNVNQYEKTGYKFTGWNTDPDGVGTPYKDQQEVINLKSGDGETLTLYAQWENNEYYLTYDPNNGILPEGTVNPKTLHINEEYGVLPSATRVGYNLNGWFTAKIGGTQVASNTKSKAEDTTIYAQWTPINYSITYDLNGGNVDKENPTSYTIETDTFTLNNPTKVGYTFTGWSGTGLESLSKTVTINKNSTGNRKYTANWETNKYTYEIVYESNSGIELGTNTIEGMFGSSTNVNPKEFVGYTSPEAQTVNFDSISIKTITFKYTPITYSISYNLNGGSASNKTSYTIETESFTLTNPTKSNNTFIGWTGSNGSNSSTSITISKGSYGDKSYIANWRAWINQYRCRYWGSWSGWQDAAVSASSTRQTNTRTVYQNWGSWTSKETQDLATAKTIGYIPDRLTNSMTKASNTSTTQYQSIAVYGMMKNTKGCQTSWKKMVWGYDPDLGKNVWTPGTATSGNNMTPTSFNSGVTSSTCQITGFWNLGQFGYGGLRYGSSNVYGYLKTTWQVRTLNTTWTTSAGSNGYNSKTQYQYRDMGGWSTWTATDCTSGYAGRETRYGDYSS